MLWEPTGQTIPDVSGTLFEIVIPGMSVQVVIPSVAERSQVRFVPNAICWHVFNLTLERPSGAEELSLALQRWVLRISALSPARDDRAP